MLYGVLFCIVFLFFGLNDMILFFMCVIFVGFSSFLNVGVIFYGFSVSLTSLYSSGLNMNVFV